MGNTWAEWIFERLEHPMFGGAARPANAKGNRPSRLFAFLFTQAQCARQLLRRKLATTNPIESCLSTVQRVARNVKRWREGDQPLRWTATGLLEAEKRFRRIKEYREILLLKERLNPSRIQQKEARTIEVA